MIKLLSDEKVPPRALIKKITGDTKSKSGLDWAADASHLPKAEIVMVAERIKDILHKGDKVYYVDNGRGLGKVIHDGSEHWTIEIGNIVGIYEINNNSRIKPPYSREAVAIQGSLCRYNYSLEMFDHLFKHPLLKSNSEYVLSCKPESFKQIKSILNELNASSRAIVGEFRNDLGGVEKDTLFFHRGSHTVHVVLESETTFDLMWPFKTDVRAMECIIIDPS
jgi:hypothetical protein